VEQAVEGGHHGVAGEDLAPVGEGLVGGERAKDRLFATARVERSWRTLKELTNVKADQSLNLDDLEARALGYYLCFRPHQGLAGATPAEVFLGVEPACTKAVGPPRGQAGEGPQQRPFEVGFLDPEKRAFPILKQAA
jgi:hypothetical protein